MTRSLRVLIEALLPWYHPSVEQKRDARTARITRRSEVARLRAERVIAEYRRAESKSHTAVDRLIEEVRR